MKFVAALIFIAFVLIIAWGIFTKVGAHPMLIDAAYPTNDAQANHLFAPCPLTPHNLPIMPDRRI